MRNPFRKRKVRQTLRLVSVSTLQLIPILEDGSELPVITTEGRLSRGWIHYEACIGEVDCDVKVRYLIVRFAGLECAVGCHVNVSKGTILTYVGNISIDLHGQVPMSVIRP